MKKSIYSNEYTLFREMIRETREGLNLSQESLGKMLGRHQPFVARIESGQRRLDVVEFIHVMKTMGVNPVSFLKKLEAKIGKSGTKILSSDTELKKAIGKNTGKAQSKSSAHRTTN